MEKTMKVVGFIPGEILGRDDQVPVRERMQAYLDSLGERREEKQFEKIKRRLFKRVINSNEELRQYYKDIRLLKKASKVDSPTDKQLLQEKRNVWLGAVGTEKSDRRNLIINTLAQTTSVVSTLGAIGFIAVSLPVSLFLSAIGCAVGLTSHLITFSKYKKRQTFNQADSTAKARDYEKVLEKFIEATEKYNEVIDANRDVIMQAKKSMSRSKFKKFMKDFREDTFKELGLETFLTAETDKEKSDLPQGEQVDAKKTTVVDPGARAMGN